MAVCSRCSGAAVLQAQLPMIPLSRGDTESRFQSRLVPGLRACTVNHDDQWPCNL